MCRHICKKAGVAVIDEAYRLVAEDAFPCGITDSFGALKYVCERGTDDAGVPLCLVVVGTHVIDDISHYQTAKKSPFASMRENEYVPTLIWGRLHWFDQLNVRSLGSTPEQVTQARKRIPEIFVNLLKATDFTNLAPTVIYTAVTDPLDDEGEACGRLVIKHGVEVTMKRFPGVPHPLLQMNKDLWQASEFIDQIAKAIKQTSHDLVGNGQLSLDRNSTKHTRSGDRRLGLILRPSFATPPRESHRALGRR